MEKYYAKKFAVNDFSNETWSSWERIQIWTKLLKSSSFAFFRLFLFHDRSHNKISIEFKSFPFNENQNYIIIFYYLSPQTRQSMQHTLYERLLVYINFYLINRDVWYRQVSYIIYRFCFENKWYFMNSYNSYVSRFFFFHLDGCLLQSLRSVPVTLLTLLFDERDIYAIRIRTMHQRHSKIHFLCVLPLVIYNLHWSTHHLNRKNNSLNQALSQACESELSNGQNIEQSCIQ